MEEHGSILLYQTEDGLTKIETRLENETVWLSIEQMAELFHKDRTIITKHIKNVFEEDELVEQTNVQNLHIANSDKPVKFYSLDVIISVDYRVKAFKELSLDNGQLDDILRVEEDFIEYIFKTTKTLTNNT